MSGECFARMPAAPSASRELRFALFYVACGMVGETELASPILNLGTASCIGWSGRQDATFSPNIL
jgi:hypothetical protein